MPKAETGSQRVQRRRDKMRAAGLRPIQIWVPDTGAPGFAEACGRQVRLVREAETAAVLVEDEAWFELSDRTDWTA